MNLPIILLTIAALATAVPNSTADRGEKPVRPATFIVELAEDETLGPGDGGDQIAGKGTRFSRKNKEVVKNDNASRNAGKNNCENCGVETVPGQQHQKGVTPPSNEAQVDHVTPRSKGGQGVPENGQVLCRECNLEKSDKAP